MFEKEAIIHAFEATIGIECLNKPIEDFTYEELSDEQQEKAYDFKKGAEFGYNKAKVEVEDSYRESLEWHYVKDEGTPKVEGHYLVCLRNKDRDIFDCWIYYDKDVGWYSMKVRMKDIYAWEKIVFPALPKEIKEK